MFLYTSRLWLCRSSDVQISGFEHLIFTMLIKSRSSVQTSLFWFVCLFKGQSCFLPCFRLLFEILNFVGANLAKMHQIPQYQRAMGFLTFLHIMEMILNLIVLMVKSFCFVWCGLCNHFSRLAHEIKVTMKALSVHRPLIKGYGIMEWRLKTKHRLKAATVSIIQI